jgi:hypothetical protein
VGGRAGGDTDGEQLTSPAAMAIAAAGAEVGIFCRQGGRLDPVDGVGVGVLRGDGSTALALADKRALLGAVSGGASGGRQARQAKRASKQAGGQDGKGTHGDLGLELARQLLQVCVVVVGGHVLLVGHGEVGVAAVRVLVLVLASVLVVQVKGGSEDRGADW